MSEPGGPPNRRALPTVRMLSVGRFFGVPIFFAPSWLIIAALLTFYYGPIVRDAVPGVSSSASYLVSFGYALAFALCVLAHEIGHTAVSLLLHKPVKRIVIFLLGGVSEIETEPDRPRDEFYVAVAGPAVSAVITVIFGAVSYVLDDDTLAGVLILLLFWSNLVVCVFNLMPGLPLDGGRVLRSAVWAATKSQLIATRAGAWTGRAVAVGVVALTAYFDRDSSYFATGFIGILLAIYLWVGAGQALRAAEIMSRLPKVDIEALLRPGLLVPDTLSIDAALQRMWQGSARGLVLVDSADQPSAIVDEAKVNAVDAAQRPWTLLRTVARPLEAGLILPRGLTGQQLLDAIKRTPASEYLVVDDKGAPAGIIATADLAAALGSAQA